MKYLTFLSGLLWFILFPFSASSQQTYSYQDLSSFSYKKQKDSIAKNWVCPVVFTVKETQAKYKELWNSRTSYITNAIQSNDFIREPELYAYVNQIIKDIAGNNPQHIKGLPLLFIDRSANVNAYSLGNNVLIVNAGMIAFCKSREELALAIAHELSHELLKHTENAMRESAMLLSSDEYKKSLDAILTSEYERLTKLKKVLTGYTFSRNRHNRYHESEADSMAILMLKKSNISFDPVFFLRLDSSDIQYKQELQQPVKNYFQVYKLPMEDNWFVKRSKGLSSRSYNFKDSTLNEDSLKTHPDCIQRYNHNKDYITVKGTFTAIPIALQEKAKKIMLWDLFNNMRLASCLYRILQEKDKGNTDSWYDFMAYNVLAGLHYANVQLRRFNAIGIRPKEDIAKSYHELQTMLEQIPGDKLELLSKEMIGQPFWSKVGDEARGFRSVFEAVSPDDKETDKKIGRAAKEFTGLHPFSMYCEFTEHFK
jgi:Zn-dependent protease with chaperone function